MKQGAYFTIPERPGDVDQLRSQAARLQPHNHPRWLDKADADYYRYLGNGSSSGLSATERKQFLREIEQLQLAGLVVDADVNDPEARHLYIRATGDYDIWSIGIYVGDSPLAMHDTPNVANPVITRDDVDDVPAVFVADPFMARQRDGWFMFFEILNWHGNKGEISLATSDDGLDWQYQQRVLVEPFHLSYPYVFESDGEYFMIPETRQIKEVRLYRAVDFPTGWSHEATLLQGDEWVDASVFLKDGRWWMLAASPAGGGSDTLRLYSAGALTQQWTEHPSSPVVQGDPHIARPGGRVVSDNDRWLRFAQNCSPRYGLDVRAFEITELTTSSYTEVPIGPHPILGPSGTRWNAGGMHHLDAHRLDDGRWIACVDGWKEPC